MDMEAARRLGRLGCPWVYLPWRVDGIVYSLTGRSPADDRSCWQLAFQLGSAAELVTFRNAVPALPSRPRPPRGYSRQVNARLLSRWPRSGLSGPALQQQDSFLSRPNAVGHAALRIPRNNGASDVSLSEFAV